MSQNSCCVPGCLTTKNDGIPLHHFPNQDKNAEKFNSWIFKIGGHVATMDVLGVYINIRVCHKHFEDIYKYPGNRLSKFATPVLVLPGILLHHFPNRDKNAEKFNSWISKIGGRVATSDVLGVYINRRVCHKHFEDIYKYPRNR